MDAEEQGTLLVPDPDAGSARMSRGGTARNAAARAAEQARPVEPGTGCATAEATLNLEPLRAPITGMVQGTLRAEREALERMGAELRAELGHLHEWRVREEAMRVDQTTLYRRAAEEWRAAAEGAWALQASSDELAGAAQELRGVVDAAGARFWRRAMLAAWLVSLVGLGMVVGLCGVVWLALAQR